MALVVLDEGLKGDCTHWQVEVDEVNIASEQLYIGALGARLEENGVIAEHFVKRDSGGNIGGKSEFYNFTEVESLAIEEVHKLVKVIVIIMANHDELISFVKIMKCFDRFAIYSYKAPAKTVLKFLYNGYGSLYDLITGNIKCEFVIFRQLAYEVDGEAGYAPPVHLVS